MLDSRQSELLHQRRCCQYIIDAVGLVADEGWKLLPDYRFDPHSGLLRHRSGQITPPLRLDDLSYGPDGRFTIPPRIGRLPKACFRCSLPRQGRFSRSGRPIPICSTTSPPAYQQSSKRFAGSPCPTSV